MVAVIAVAPTERRVAVRRRTGAAMPLAPRSSLTWPTR